MLIERQEDRWNTNGVAVGDIMRLEEPGFDARIGDGWAKGRLRQGDVIVAVAHTGDGFFDYLLLQEQAFLGSITLRPIGPSFGSYRVGRKVGTVAERDMPGLMKGVPAVIEYDEGYGYRDPFADAAEGTTTETDAKAPSSRDLPASTRIAIATVSMRYRTARRQTESQRAAHGSEHLSTMIADARTMELWNTLVTMRQRVGAEVQGRRISYGSAKAFLRMVGLQAAAFRRSRR